MYRFFQQLFALNKQRLPAVLAEFKRTAWLPRVADEDGVITDSKFAGTPYLLADEEWPACDHCGQPMPLFLQLNLSTLPEAVRGEFGSGLLQLFYCTNTDPFCEAEAESFFPFMPGKLVRVIQPTQEVRQIALPEAMHPFPPKTIIGWQAADDYPNQEEGQAQGLELSDQAWERLSEQGFPCRGDKLAGWPMWIQGVEYPACPICQRRMRLVFQIDSNDHLPYMFGDLGCGHITQCPTHHDQVTFGWACS
jgi:uncharacterized protein YwqG